MGWYGRVGAVARQSSLRLCDWATARAGRLSTGRLSLMVGVLAISVISAHRGTVYPLAGRIPSWILADALSGLVHRYGDSGFSLAGLSISLLGASMGAALLGMMAATVLDAGRAGRLAASISSRIACKAAGTMTLFLVVALPVASVTRDYALIQAIAPLQAVALTIVSLCQLLLRRDAIDAASHRGVLRAALAGSLAAADAGPGACRRPHPTEQHARA